MLLFFSISTILLSFILIIYNWRLNPNAILLALFFMSFGSYGITHYFVVYSHSPFWVAIFYTHFSPLWLLPGPLLYFYVKGTLEDKTNVRWKDAWHLMPFLINLIGITPYIIQPFSYKINLAETILSNLDG